MDRQRKKEEKALKRKKRLEGAIAHKRVQEHQSKLRSRYPSIFVEPTGADEGFIALVKSAVQRLDFDSPGQFSDLHRQMFKFMAVEGWSLTRLAIESDARRLLAQGNEHGNFLLVSFLNAIGTQLYKFLTEPELQKHLPYNDMRVFPVEKSFVIRFTQLMKAKGPKGTVYFSRHRPKVVVGNQELTVAFTRHAIERIVERINTKSLEYTPAGDVHALFSHNTHFEIVSLSDGQPAMTFFDYCFFPGSIHYKTYVTGILGEENYDKSKGHVYYRVGYCPIAIEGDFAKGITFLPPGYDGTPEHISIMESTLPNSEKQRLKRLFKNDAGHILRIEDSLDELRWFHQNSAPQVIQSKSDFFKHS